MERCSEIIVDGSMICPEQKKKENSELDIESWKPSFSICNHTGTYVGTFIGSYIDKLANSCSGFTKAVEF